MSNLASVKHEVVSFEDEELILVDEHDNEIGNLSKDKCHDGNGVLHRAFSLFIFNEQGEVLLQQRSAQKRLWPLYWSNTCCSHPRRNETMELAVERRLEQELGMSSDCLFLFKFIYHANFNNIGSEHELCWVYLGKSKDEVTVNANEIADWRHVSIEQLNIELEQNGEAFTPWMKLEWERIQKEFYPQLQKFAEGN